MNELPKKIIRKDDGAEFLLNEKDELYYLWLPIKGLNQSGMHGYTFDRLINDPRSMGVFKVADGTENTVAMRDAWYKRVKAMNSGGCGD